jgi:excisionase family DNA binding protein
VSDERPLSTGEVARLLHVTPVAVLGWIRAGKLSAYRVAGGRHRIPRAEFRKFLADNQIPLTLEPPASRRILFVDDNAAVREAFGAILQTKGCEVVLASDGPEALEIIRENHFDLIFLDIILPNLSGAALIGEVKRWDPEAVVVIVTGHPHHEETLAALEHGPAMLLAKPIRLSDIEAVLKIVFEDEKRPTG